MLTMAQRETIIATYTGKLIHPFMLRGREIDIRDIAHGLSMICRFGGQCREFYCVADHSIRVKDLLMSWGATYEVQLYGLLHDASEAYPPGDLLAPVGRFFGAARRLRRRVQDAIYTYYRAGGPDDLQQEMIKRADLQMLAAEARALFSNWRAWPELKSAAGPWMRGPLTSAQAEERFLIEFNRLVMEWEAERWHGRDK